MSLKIKYTLYKFEIASIAWRSLDEAAIASLILLYCAEMWNTWLSKGYCRPPIVCSDGQCKDAEWNTYRRLWAAPPYINGLCVISHLPNRITVTILINPLEFSIRLYVHINLSYHKVYKEYYNEYILSSTTNLLNKHTNVVSNCFDRIFHF